jgi:predicted transcriptional regulator
MIPLQNAVKRFKLCTLPADSSVAEALLLIVDSDFQPVLVPRRERSDAFGIVTKHDIVHKVIAEGKDPRSVRVHEIMSKPLITVNDLTMDLRWASKMMHRTGVSTLAVMEGGEFYGFITDECIIEEYYNEMRREKVDKSGNMLSC